MQLLDLSRNRLTSWSSFAALPSLTELIVAGNAFVTVGPVATLFPALEVLDVSNNAISEEDSVARGADALTAALRSIAPISTLVELSVAGNACLGGREPPAVAAIVRAVLPHLELVDGVRVRERERSGGDAGSDSDSVEQLLQEAAAVLGPTHPGAGAAAGGSGAGSTRPSTAAGARPASSAASSTIEDNRRHLGSSPAHARPGSARPGSARPLMRPPSALGPAARPMSARSGIPPATAAPIASGDGIREAPSGSAATAGILKTVLSQDDIEQQTAATLAAVAKMKRDISARIQRAAPGAGLSLTSQAAGGRAPSMPSGGAADGAPVAVHRAAAELAPPSRTQAAAALTADRSNEAAIAAGPRALRQALEFARGGPAGEDGALGGSGQAEPSRTPLRSRAAKSPIPPEAEDEASDRYLSGELPDSSEYASPGGHEFDVTRETASCTSSTEPGVTKRRAAADVLLPRSPQTRVNAASEVDISAPKLRKSAATAAGSGNPRFQISFEALRAVGAARQAGLVASSTDNRSTGDADEDASPADGIGDGDDQELRERLPRDPPRSHRATADVSQEEQQQRRPHQQEGRSGPGPLFQRPPSAAARAAIVAPQYGGRLDASADGARAAAQLPGTGPAPRVRIPSGLAAALTGTELDALMASIGNEAAKP